MPLPSTRAYFLYSQKMDEIYLEIFSDPSKGSDTTLVPLESLVALFTISYIKSSRITLKLIVKIANDVVPFAMDISKNSYEVIKECGVPQTVSDCVLPSVLVNTPTGQMCIAGLSAVLRQIIKTNLEIYPEQRSLLGFRDGCLAACAEASLWTRFCEIDILRSTKEYVANIKSESGDEFVLPVDLARFEKHMEQPLRIHNVQKKMQEHAKCLKVSDIDFSLSKEFENINLKIEEKELEHRFAEGHSLTLADIILFSCIYIIFQSSGVLRLERHVPLVKRWFDRMLHENAVKDTAKMILIEELPLGAHKSCSLPLVPNQSLYKSDPRRYKPRARSFTRQDEIESSLNLVSEMGLRIDWSAIPFGMDIDLDWSTVPLEAQPLGGNLPESRLKRKSEQLENLAKAVLKIAKPGQTVVDFCSGSGHLGILLAHFLPQCQVILLDNKEESLRRARDRVASLSFPNITVYQCNLDYFIGKFDIGVSLHACGVATDLVIQRCLDQEAVFVCCPCCYGGVQNNHAVTYPRSQFFRNSAITMREYLVLGHSADQTHDETNSKTYQGKLCMEIIDADRSMQATECGYKVHLSKLIPETCTPKNNMLVGLPPNFLANKT